MKSKNKKVKQKKKRKEKRNEQFHLHRQFINPFSTNVSEVG